MTEANASNSCLSLNSFFRLQSMPSELRSLCKMLFSLVSIPPSSPSYCCAHWIQNNKNGCPDRSIVNFHLSEGAFLKISRKLFSIAGTIVNCSKNA
jgi:hypothetical protein